MSTTSGGGGGVSPGIESWDPKELKKLAGVRDEELVDKLFQELQWRLPTKLFDKMTEKLLEEEIVMEDALGSIYDQLTVKMHKMLKQRLFERLQNWSSGKTRKMTDDGNSSLSDDEVQLVEVVGTDAKLSPATSNEIQSCGAKPVKRKLRRGSTNEVKKRPPVPVDQPVIHALMIDHVLDTIFDNFVLEDEDYGAKNLAKFRLVCRTWNTRATEALRKTEREVKFEGTDFELKSWNPDSKLKRYMGTMANSPLIPIRCYSLNLDILSKLNGKLLTKFLRTIGQDAVTLKFHFGNHISVPLNISRTNFKLPNLERLEIFFRKPHFTICPLIAEDPQMNNTTGIPQFIRKLLAGTSKLKAFVFRENVRSRRCPPRMLTWIPQTVNSVQLGLQVLSAPYFNALAQAKLQLLELSLNLCDSGFEPEPVQDVDEQAVNNFFQMQDESLTVLILSGLSTSILSKNFRQVGGLRSLTVKLESFGSLPPSVSISDAFPNLRVLKLDRLTINLREVILLNPPGEIITSVEELHMLFETHQENNVIELLAKRFPNLKTLLIRLYKDSSLQTVSSVCTYFTEIEELYLPVCSHSKFYDFDVNAILCGISSKVCQMLLHNNNFRRVDLESFLERPCLMNLTKLKKLVVTSSSNSNAIPLTDVSAHHILLKMENLKEVGIPNLKLTSNYLDQLNAKLKIFHSRQQPRDDDYKDDIENESFYSEEDFESNSTDSSGKLW